MKRDSKGVLYNEYGYGFGVPAEIPITGFTFQGEGLIYDAITAEPIDGFAGHCIVYFPDGEPGIFLTWVSNGERHWWSVGNNPKRTYRFASHAKEGIKTDPNTGKPITALC